MWVDLILELCVFKTILIIWLSEDQTPGEKKAIWKYDVQIQMQSCQLNCNSLQIASHLDVFFNYC